MKRYWYQRIFYCTLVFPDIVSSYTPFRLAMNVPSTYIQWYTPPVVGSFRTNFRTFPIFLGRKIMFRSVPAAVAVITQARGLYFSARTGAEAPYPCGDHRGNRLVLKLNSWGVSFKVICIPRPDNWPYGRLWHDSRC